MLEFCEWLFVWVFFAEMVALLIGLGFKNYRSDHFRVFDGIIAILGLVDFTLSVANQAKVEQVDKLMSAFRALRILRVIKLARHWKAFQRMLL